MSDLIIKCPQCHETSVYEADKEFEIGIRNAAYEKFAERLKKNAIPILLRNQGIYCKGVGTKEIDKICELLKSL